VILELLYSPGFGSGVANGWESGVVSFTVAAERGDAGTAVEPFLCAEVVPGSSDGQRLNLPFARGGA
jgi:hypothetical protein